MVYIVAELGSNPYPEWKTSDFIRQAAAAGANAVKIQMFKGSHFPEEEHKELFEYPRDKLGEDIGTAMACGIGFGASVFDDEAAELAGVAHCNFIKLAAREQYNYDLWLKAENMCLKHGSRLIRSIVVPVKILSWNRREIFLGVVPKYPAGMRESIRQLYRSYQFFSEFDLKWGWSSHTTGILDCLLAVMLGASIIEKHFATAPDQIEAGHSLQPNAFKNMTKWIRRLE